MEEGTLEILQFRTIILLTGDVTVLFVVSKLTFASDKPQLTARTAPEPQLWVNFVFFCSYGAAYVIISAKNWDCAPQFRTKLTVSPTNHDASDSYVGFSEMDHFFGGKWHLVKVWQSFRLPWHKYSYVIIFLCLRYIGARAFTREITIYALCKFASINRSRKNYHSFHFNVFCSYSIFSSFSTRKLINI